MRRPETTPARAAKKHMSKINTYTRQLARELTLEQAEAFLRQALPSSDIAQAGGDMPRRVAAQALKVRDWAPWGGSIPQDIFKAWVLFPRVNNEYWEEDRAWLWERVSPGLERLPMDQAALAVNYWCYQMATYRSTSPRTASPRAVINAGYGRCGEESTLTVSALRSVGIPARQAYVPRWAHCDDNHAWVEVWVEGAWHYMGACEPEPVLDSGWFTAAASKAMLVHTRCYGLFPQGERVEWVRDGAYEINRTGAYALARVLTVRVTCQGKPAAGVSVRFEVFNHGEFYAICEKVTGPAGTADLLTGLGELWIRGIQGGRWVCAKTDVRCQDSVELRLEDAVEWESQPTFFSLTPPAETRVQPTLLPGEALRAHKAKLAAAEGERKARLAACLTGHPLADRGLGNASQIMDFLNNPAFLQEDKESLLNSLPEKDFFDMTANTLADALAVALPFKGGWPSDIWRKYLLCPRVAWEMRLPIRSGLRAALPPDIRDASALWRHIAATVACRDMMPATVYPDSLTALRRGFTSPTGRDVLFVDACRCLGIPARLNPLTWEKEYWREDGFTAVEPQSGGEGALVLENGTGSPLAFGPSLGVTQVREGRDYSLRLLGQTLEDQLSIPVKAGRYHVNVATRQIDGAVEGWVIPVEVPAGGQVRLRVAPPPQRIADKLIWAELPPIRLTSGRASPLRLCPRGGMAAFVSPGEEPTEHFLNELVERAAWVNRRDYSVALMVNEPAALDDERIRRALAQLKRAKAYLCVDVQGLRAWRLLMRCGDARKPFCAAISRDGRGLFAFANYRVGTVDALMDILDCAQAHHDPQKE